MAALRRHKGTDTSVCWRLSFVQLPGWQNGFCVGCGRLRWGLEGLDYELGRVLCAIYNINSFNNKHY